MQKKKASAISPDKAAPVAEGKMLSISYPESQLGLFANHMIAQNAGSEFHLSFFQLHSPIITGTDEEVSAALAKVDSVVAKQVVRLVIPISQVLPIIEVLQKQLLSQKPKPN